MVGAVIRPSEERGPGNQTRRQRGARALRDCCNAPAKGLQRGCVGRLQRRAKLGQQEAVVVDCTTTQHPKKSTGSHFRRASGEANRRRPRAYWCRSSRSACRLKLFGLGSARALACWRSCLAIANSFSESRRLGASPSIKSDWLRCASSAMTMTLRRFANSGA